MSHLLWYTRHMIMKENNKANNLLLGAIYINANTGQPMRLITIVPCQGVWMETYDGQGYGELIKFEDVQYADMDEVQDFLDDHAVFMGNTKAPSHKEVEQPYQMPFDDVIIERGFVRADDVHYVGYYDDGHGNDIRCRDQETKL